MAQMKLYGICREVGYCVDTCGLCSQINGIPADKAPALRPVVLPAPKPKRERRQWRCEACGMIKRVNHNCKANRPPKKLGRPPRHSVPGSDTPLAVSCGCLFLAGKRIKYCDKHFSERGL